MTTKDAIIQKLREHAHIPAAVTESTHLYKDLGFDSLAFTSLLVELEDAHGIIFKITEMEACLQVGRLIAAVENKIKERDRGHDQASVAQPEDLG